jgi:uncharacterized protein (DUF1778 family)
MTEPDDEYRRLLQRGADSIAALVEIAERTSAQGFVDDASKEQAQAILEAVTLLTLDIQHERRRLAGLEPPKPN